MNHDIAHCDNYDCPARECCCRFQAHIEAEKLKLPYVAYLDYTKQPWLDYGHCLAFWPVDDV